MAELIPASPAELQPEATRKRNFFYAVSNGIFFMFADSLFEPVLVVTALASQLTQSSFLLGLLVPLNAAGWYLPQFLISGYVQNQPRKITVYQRMSLIRVACWLTLALAINLIKAPAMILIALYLTYTVASVASGIGGLPFLEVISKTVPARRRGEVFAWRLGLGGAAGILASVIVRSVLAPESGIPFPNNYGVLAGGFFLFASLSLVLFNRIDELPDAAPPPRRTLSEQLKIGLGILRGSANYRLLITAQALIFLAGSASPFYAIYVQRELGGDPAWIGVYLGVSMAANLLSNLTFGWLSRKVGNQRVLVIGALAGTAMAVLMVTVIALAPLLQISAEAASIVLVPVFFLLGVRGTAVGVSTPSLMMNIIPPGERSLMIGFTQTTMGLVLLVNMLSGLVVDGLGYLALMSVSAAAYLAALIIASRLREKVD